MAYTEKLSLNTMMSVTELAKQHTHTHTTVLFNYLIFVFLKNKAEFIKRECYIETKWWGEEMSNMILEILKYALPKNIKIFTKMGRYCLQGH